MSREEKWERLTDCANRVQAVGVLHDSELREHLHLAAKLGFETNAAMQQAKLECIQCNARAW